MSVVLSCTWWCAGLWLGGQTRISLGSQLASTLLGIAVALALAREGAKLSGSSCRGELAGFHNVPPELLLPKSP